LPFWRKPQKRDLTYEMARALGIVGTPSLAGVAVSESASLSISAFYRACRVKSESVGGIPLNVYQKTAAGRDEADDHSLSPVVHDEANPEQSAVSFWTQMEFWSCLYSNAYAEIERDGAGNVLALWPIMPTNVQVGRFKAGGLAYKVQAGGGEIVLPAADVIHLRGPSLDNSVGARLVELAKQSLGLALAQDRAGAAYFGNAGRPSIIFETPEPMAEEDRAKLREAYQSCYAGSDKAGAMMLLTGGMTAKPVNSDDQFLSSMTEARQFQVEEICRWVGVFPWFVFSMGRATWNNSANQKLDYLQFCLDPDLRQIESEINRKCFRPAERRQYYVEFCRDHVIKLDPLTQRQVWQIDIQNGIRNPNECRHVLNLPPYDGGDEFMSLAPAPAPAPQDQPQKETDDSSVNTDDGD
jgi:HK97 family phage portal protein